MAQDDKPEEQNDIHILSSNFTISQEVRLRDLGLTEHHRTILHDLSFHPSLSIGALYSYTPPESPLAVFHRAIFLALRETIRRHPMLGVQIRYPPSLSSPSTNLSTNASTNASTNNGHEKGKIPRPYFTHLQQINLEDVVQFRSLEVGHRGPRQARKRAEMLEQLMEEEASWGFGLDRRSSFSFGPQPQQQPQQQRNQQQPEQQRQAFTKAADKPLWRLQVLDLGVPPENKTVRVLSLIFTWHPALSDAVGGMAFHGTMLAALNRATSEASTTIPPATMETTGTTTAAATPRRRSITFDGRASDTPTIIDLYTADNETEGVLLPSMEETIGHHKSWPRFLKENLSWWFPTPPPTAVEVGRWVGGRYTHPCPSPSASSWRFSACSSRFATLSFSPTVPASPSGARRGSEGDIENGRVGRRSRPALVPTTTSTQGVRLIFITPIATSGLRARCRTQDTSITAFLQVAVSRSLLEVCGGKQIRCETSLGLRRLLPVGDGTTRQRGGVMGVMMDTFVVDTASSLATQMGRSGEEPGKKDEDEADLRFWQECRRHKNVIDGQVSKGCCDMGFSTLRDSTDRDMREELRGKIGRQRDVSFGLSNVGVFAQSACLSEKVNKDEQGKRGMQQKEKEKDKEDWKVLSLIMSPGVRVDGGALQLGVASADGGMVVSVGWQRGVVGEGEVEGLVRKLRGVLEGVGRGGKVGGRRR